MASIQVVKHGVALTHLVFGVRYRKFVMTRDFCFGHGLRRFNHLPVSRGLGDRSSGLKSRHYLVFLLASRLTSGLGPPKSYYWLYETGCEAPAKPIGYY